MTPTPTTYTLTTWNQVRRNDWIVCPTSGLPEQVTRSQRRRAGNQFVRTTRHDHFRVGTDPVEVARPDA
jgi:hypothetical protein